MRSCVVAIHIYEMNAITFNLSTPFPMCVGGQLLKERVHVSGVWLQISFGKTGNALVITLGFIFLRI